MMTASLRSRHWRQSCTFSNHMNCNATASFTPMQDGDLQLFGLEESGILDAMPLDDAHVTAVAALEAEPYLLLGCASGAIRVVALLGAGGGTAEGVAPINSMEMLPYTRESVCEKSRMKHH